MKTVSKDRILGSTILGVLALWTSVFGGYLIYEKVYLSIVTAQIEERVGIILQAVEPIGFWAWVMTYAIAGAGLCITGIWFFKGAVGYWFD